MKDLASSQFRNSLEFKDVYTHRLVCVYTVCMHVVCQVI